MEYERTSLALKHKSQLMMNLESQMKQLKLKIKSNKINDCIKGFMIKNYAIFSDVNQIYTLKSRFIGKKYRNLKFITNFVIS